MSIYIGLQIPFNSRNFTSYHIIDYLPTLAYYKEAGALKLMDDFIYSMIDILHYHSSLIDYFSRII